MNAPEAAAVIAAMTGNIMKAFPAEGTLFSRSTHDS